MAITKDKDGLPHSYDDIPCECGDGLGDCEWRSHGRYHRECGKSEYSSTKFMIEGWGAQRYWDLYDAPLHGRLLLW